MARWRRLAASLLTCGGLLFVGCSTPPPAPVAPAPAPADPVPPTPPPAVDAPAAADDLQYRHEELAHAPQAVQDWAGKLRNVPIGAALNHGGRTYLLVAAPEICPEAASLSFWSVKTLPENQGIQATASFHCTEKQRAQPVALSSIPATEKPITFDLKYSLLPHLNNPHNLPLPALPAKGSGVIVQPVPGATVGNRVSISGFAANLFEGTLNLRLVDPAGKVVAETHGTSAGGMGPNWGSFVVELDASKAPPGRYWLELGDYSMQDGAWQLKQRIEVIKQ
ncbi:MAG TPA: Gmad2 immunoglobulin-like domain-containing protein [Symbiobacteriaceae bacterium]|nr:Gmad2 immunoglobulin-like domain-containing protein [Symbiobacteriaceae bacterium]